MYTVNKTRNRKKLAFSIMAGLLLVFAVIAGVFWIFVIRDNDSSSANFNRTGGTVAVVRPATEEFTTDEFSIELPSGWKLKGKENPFADEVFYNFQSDTTDYTNRWLRVYVNVYPNDIELARLLPITVEANKIKPGLASNDCKTFDGAPKQGTQASKQVWTAVWEGISFNCNMTNQLNYLGTATEQDGFGVPITGEKSGTNKYFFVYIDHNVRPDYSILNTALKSFEAL